MTESTEAEELGAGVLDYLRGFYPVADDMPTMYHHGARLAAVALGNAGQATS
jgi:hypothetical protein